MTKYEHLVRLVTERSRYERKLTEIRNLIHEETTFHCKIILRIIDGEMLNPPYEDDKRSAEIFVKTLTEGITTTTTPSPFRKIGIIESHYFPALTLLIGFIVGWVGAIYCIAEPLSK